MGNKNIKHFPEWMELKGNIHNVGRIPKVKEGEIWWCAMGENVGVEINGKSKTFARPIVIFKKLNRYSFMGIPLTSKHHFGEWYTPFIFKGKHQVAVLAQARVVSVSRLYDKIGEMSDSDLKLVKIGFKNLYVVEK